MTSTASVPLETEFQRLLVEQALALAREVESAAGAAPHGQGLDRGEGLLLTRGRHVLLGVLPQMAPHTADAAGKKGGSLASARAATPLRPTGTAARVVVTALGPIPVRRVSLTGFAGGGGRSAKPATLRPTTSPPGEQA